MKIIFVFLIMLTCFSACKEKAEPISSEVPEQKFDKNKWQIKEGEHYLHRKSMYKDVLYSNEIRSKSKEEVLGLLGEADRHEANHYYYNISSKKMGAWTLSSSTLVIKFSDEGDVEWIKLHG